MVTSRTLFILAWYENNWQGAHSFWRHFQFPAFLASPCLERRRLWQLEAFSVQRCSYLRHSISGSVAVSIDFYWLIEVQRAPNTFPKCGHCWRGKTDICFISPPHAKKWHFQQSKDKVCETDPLFLLQHRNPRATSAGREVGLTTPGGPTFQQSNSRNSRKNSTSTNIWRELGELRSLLRCNLTRPRWGVGKQPNNKVLKFPDDDMTDRPLT